MIHVQKVLGGFPLTTTVNWGHDDNWVLNPEPSAIPTR